MFVFVGPIGSSGIPGAPGERGAQGLAGSPGSRGPPGVDGSDGKDGTCPNSCLSPQRVTEAPTTSGNIKGLDHISSKNRLNVSKINRQRKIQKVVGGILYTKCAKLAAGVHECI